MTKEKKPKKQERRGRPKRANRETVRTVTIEFAATPKEREALDQWAEDANKPSRAAFIRSQCGLTEEPTDDPSEVPM
jgi:hypothetical protein